MATTSLQVPHVVAVCCNPALEQIPRGGSVLCPPSEPVLPNPHRTPHGHSLETSMQSCPRDSPRVRLGRPAHFSKVGKEYKWQLASLGGHSHYAHTAIEKQWTR